MENAHPPGRSAAISPARRAPAGWCPAPPVRRPPPCGARASTPRRPAARPAHRAPRPRTRPSAPTATRPRTRKAAPAARPRTPSAASAPSAPATATRRKHRKTRWRSVQKACSEHTVYSNSLQGGFGRTVPRSWARPGAPSAGLTIRRPLLIVQWIERVPPKR